MVLKTTRYGRKSIRPDRMQATETVCYDDFTDESDFESESDEDEYASDADQDGNLKGFVRDEIEYDSSTDDEDLWDSEYETDLD